MVDLFMALPIHKNMLLMIMSVSFKCKIWQHWNLGDLFLSFTSYFVWILL